MDIVVVDWIDKWDSLQALVSYSSCYLKFYAGNWIYIDVFHGLWYQLEQIVQYANGIWKEIGCNIIIVQAETLQFCKAIITEARYLQWVVCLVECIVAIGVANAFSKHVGELVIAKLHRMHLLECWRILQYNKFFKFHLR